MANDDVKQRILEWCTVDDNLQLVEERSDPGADFLLALRSDGVDVGVGLVTGSDRVVARNVAEVPDQVLSWRGATAEGGQERSFEETLDLLAESRPGIVDASIADEAGHRAVRLDSWVYIDGLTRHAFMASIAEVVRTRHVLDRVIAEIGGHASEATPRAAATATAASRDQEEAAATPTPTPSPAQTPTPTPMPTPTYQPAPSPTPSYAAPQPSPSAYTPAPQVYQPQPQQQPQPQPRPAPTPQPAPSGGWAPSHKVPGQGMQAWAAPDPNGAVVANLGGNLPVQVTEMRGAWAHVVCSNGWTGWVDGRLLAAGA